MKKSLILLIITILILTCCKQTSREPGNPENNREPAENEVVLFYQYVNYAWGIQNNGFYLIADGTKYSFEYEDNLTFEEIINDKNNKKMKKYSKKEMKALIEQLNSIEDNLDFEVLSAGCDIGQTSLYKIYKKENEYKSVLLGSYGDIIKKTKDKNIQDLCKKWGISF